MTTSTETTMKGLPWIIAVCATTLAGHMYLYSTQKVETLKQTIELSEKARQIENDQVRDLMYALQQERNKIDSAKTQSFVAGVVDCLQNKDAYQKVWHAGYDRGTEVQMLAQQGVTPEEKKDELGY